MGRSASGSRGTIENCTFANNLMIGIWVADGSGCTIRNGTFRDHGIFAIRCDDGSEVLWDVRGVSSAVNETIKLAGTIRVLPSGNLSLINTTVVVDDRDSEDSVYVFYDAILWLLDGDGDPNTPQDCWWTRGHRCQERFLRRYHPVQHRGEPDGRGV
jgi:parallel beta-helix repeat protein